jgi:hypothetical protein
MTFLDLFGAGGSSDQGEPTTAGAGDGAKGTAITNWLSTITGAYNAVTGAGTHGGPAVAPQVKKPTTNYLLIGGIVLAVGLVLWFLTKKH